MEIILGLDVAILEVINQSARRSTIFDWFVKTVADSAILKNIPAALLFYFLWFSPAPDLRAKREKLLALIPIAFVAVALGKGLAVLLPFRDRPLHEPDLDLILPHSVARDILDGWSSFPSDHGALFAALAACLWLVRGWAGLLAAVHALVVVALARMFLLYHYPSDIAGGALIGIAAAFLLMPPLLYVIRRLRLVELAERRPELLHPVIFFFLFQIVTLFGSLRHLGSAFLELVS